MRTPTVGRVFAVVSTALLLSDCGEGDRERTEPQQLTHQVARLERQLAALDERVQSLTAAVHRMAQLERVRAPAAAAALPAKAEDAQAPGVVPGGDGQTGSAERGPSTAPPAAGSEKTESSEIVAALTADFRRDLADLKRRYGGSPQTSPDGARELSELQSRYHEAVRVALQATKQAPGGAHSTGPDSEPTPPGAKAPP